MSGPKKLPSCKYLPESMFIESRAQYGACKRRYFHKFHFFPEDCRFLGPESFLTSRKKVMEAKKVLKTQRMLQAEKEDDEDAREHDFYIQEQVRKAAAKKKRKMAFDAKLIALTGVMDKILLLQWNNLHPSQPPPADLCMWKCKDVM